MTYALPSVQEKTLEFLTEIFRHYNVDGVELGFLRQQVFFRSTANREIVSPEEREAMTSFMRRLRETSETEGLKREKPFLISIRVPDSVDYCDDIGLDVEAWLREGLVDLLVVTSYVRLNPWEQSVALRHRYRVPVYTSLDEPRIKPGENQQLHNSITADRGRALLAWNAGVDGIYAFNRFLPKAPRWKVLGAPATLARFDKDYFASIRGASWAIGLPHESYFRIPVLNPSRPFRIPPGPGGERRDSSRRRSRRPRENASPPGIRGRRR